MYNKNYTPNHCKTTYFFLDNLIIHYLFCLEYKKIVNYFAQ